MEVFIFIVVVVLAISFGPKLFSQLTSKATGKSSKAPVEPKAPPRGASLKEREKYADDVIAYTNVLIKELQDIGLKYVDKSIPVRYETNMFSGQEVGFLTLTDSKLQPFFVTDANGKSIPDPRVVQIGHALHHVGGLEYMQSVYYHLAPSLGQYRGLLGTAWSGVGTWMN